MIERFSQIFPIRILLQNAIRIWTISLLLLKTSIISDLQVIGTLFQQILNCNRPLFNSFFTDIDKWKKQGNGFEIERVNVFKLIES